MGMALAFGITSEEKVAKSIIASNVTSQPDIEACHQNQQRAPPQRTISISFVEPPVASATPVHHNQGQKSDDEFDENAGKGVGKAIFVLILLGLLFNFVGFGIVFNVPVSLLCNIAAAVLSCCARKHNLEPKLMRFSNLILGTQCLLLVVGLIPFITAIALFSNDEFDEDTPQPEGYSTLWSVCWVLSLLLNFMAVVLSGLFVWGRGCLC